MDLVTGQLLQKQKAFRMSIAETNADAGFPRDKCIYQLFQEQAQKTPHRVAVVGADERITYRELDERSNQLGRYLQAKGVNPETLVGICLHRSIEMVVTILSILKAGGAYVPIDPDYPKDRIAFMLEDSASLILVTQAALKSKLPDTKTEIVCLDEIQAELSRQIATPIFADVKAHNLAYVIYTSGSTGRPKGVMIENRNVVRLFFNDRFQFAFSEHDVWSIFHSFCFDFSVWEMYGALLFGGKAVIVPKQATRDPHAFVDMILRERVTVINQTPSAFYSLIPYLIKVSDQASFLRYVIFGGEKLNPGKLGEIKSAFAQTILVNMYGITETTVHVTYKEITAKEIAEGFSNIGAPIPTLKVYIFDDHMQLVPKGVEGELCVGGQGVARGYLNRRELTEARFVPNPLNPEEIIYRSGDLACMRENGDLEYFGRMDKQIQLRGFRIELGEIESVLVGLQAIKDCVVTVDDTLGGDTRIIAYIIPAKEKLPINQIKEILGQKLPDYMIPSFFMEVDAFPLTDNGKLDVSKLPSPEIATLGGAILTGPENEIEKTMAAIWSALLGIDRDKIGREYNFFEIGGHSLTAMLLLEKLRQHFKKEVTIREIYEHPQLKDLCQAILHLTELKEQSSPADQDRVAPDSRYPIKSEQLAYWLATYVFKVQISNVCEIYDLNGAFDLESFQRALNDVAPSHDSLWYRFSKKSPSIRMAAPGPCAIAYIDWSATQVDGERHLDQMTAEILHKPFDLSRVPLFRIAAIKLGAEKHLLLVSFPHIICDIAAVNAFVRELFDAYGPSREKGPMAYQPRRILAKETIDYEIEYLRSPSVLPDKAFWQNRLESSSLLRFNEKYFLPRFKRCAATPKLVSQIRLEDSTLEGLHKLSAQFTASIQIVILAIIQASLHSMTRQKDISTCMVYDMGGMYPYPPKLQLNATMIPVVSQITEKVTYAGLISDLKTFLVEAQSHARLPGLIMHSIPVFSVLKQHPWLSKCLRAFARFYTWRYRKSIVHPEVLFSYVYYIFGMIAIGLKNFGRKKNNRFRHPSVVFNVLPSFYEDKKLWSSGRLAVTSIGDREMVMNPSVFEHRNTYQDAKLLNFDLLRDSRDESWLYVWGGGFSPRALDYIKQAFCSHLNSLLENPSGPIRSEILLDDSSRPEGSQG